jgi:hypothetical protein
LNKKKKNLKEKTREEKERACHTEAVKHLSLELTWKLLLS